MPGAVRNSQPSWRKCAKRGQGMQAAEVTALFDQQAASYDKRWAKTAPIRDCLHLLLASQFAGLPDDAHVLCVGVGTGDELIYLAARNPGWRFTAVEPSGRMLDVCRQRTEEAGITGRCVYFEGYLGEFDASVQFDAATCFLVSQFILEDDARSGLFSEIAARLKPGGLLASSDLASDVATPEYDVLLHAWMHMMSAADLAPETLERFRKAYANDVAVVAPERVRAIIQSGGFGSVVPFFQAGLIHGWLSQRAGD